MDRSEPPSTMKWQTEEALVGLFRTAAQGEAIVEQRRAALLQLPGFEPGEVFRALAIASAEGSQHLVDRIPLGGLCRWLHIGQGEGQCVEPSQHELARVLLRSMQWTRDSASASYTDFLRLVLPRDPMHRDVRRAAFALRTEALPAGAAGAPPAVLRGEVAYALRRLVEEEVELFRRGRAFRCELSEHLTPAEVFVLLRGPLRFTAATVTSVADFVTDQLGALNFEEAAALFRRLDAAEKGEITEEDVAVLAMPLYGDDVTCDSLPLGR